MSTTLYSFAMTFVLQGFVVASSPQDPHSLGNQNTPMIEPVVVPGIHMQSFINPALPLSHFFNSISDSMVLVVLGMLTLSILVTTLLLFYHAWMGIYRSAKYFVSVKQDEYVLIESPECKKGQSEDEVLLEKDLMEDGFEEVQLFAYDSDLPPAYDQV